MNIVILIGRLTKEPEVRYIPSTGKAVASFNIAVDRPYKDDEGNKQADFFKISVFGKIAENCGNYLVKGSLVGIKGALRNNNYEKDGEKRYTNEVIADTVQFLDNRRNNNQNDGYVPVDEIPPFY